MALYRVLRAMEKGNITYKRGDIVSAETFDEAAIAKLEFVGALSKISSPPIAEIQGWEGRAKKLEGMGITTIEHMLESDVSDVASKMRVNRATVHRWRDELEAQLAPPELGCEGCRD
jgi:hypothetical protein